MTKRPRAILQHCMSIYDAMDERADEEDVYTGYLTKLFKELNFSVPFFTTIMDELKRMGCVRQMQRGGNTKPSKWLMIERPSEELFRLAAPSVVAKKFKIADRQDQRIKDLETRVSRLEKENERP